ncbi:sensor histidine kinase [Yoonia algicola]|uniref:histidine kinase n=1 Tax=Yoonia algicola TaxID=3137368 RepID=A0AAN0NGT5_9RHOB
MIERAVGAAQLFGSLAPSLLTAPEKCAPILKSFVDVKSDFSFIGVLPLDGITRCSSAERVLDFSGFPNFQNIMETQQPAIEINQAAPASGESVFIISEPFDIDGTFAGFVSISVPHSRLQENTEEMENLGLIDLITFNDDGTMLTSRKGFDAAQAELPADIALAALYGSDAVKFRANNQRGVERRYSVVQIEGSPASMIAIWATDQGIESNLSKILVPGLFPALMWFASMGVAMLAMNTLVLSHLRQLRKKMGVFADTRELIRPGESTLLKPLELEDLEANFARMSEAILRDEAGIENALREKGVLVKEIHHRVKNNLQLISSIINMQIRGARHEETKTTLRQVQDRVVSLATIHRDLYQSQEGGGSM